MRNTSAGNVHEAEKWNRRRPVELRRTIQRMPFRHLIKRESVDSIVILLDNQVSKRTASEFEGLDAYKAKITVRA